MHEPLPQVLHELNFSRLIDAPPEKVYRAWTEPVLLMQWFCPLPWRVTHAELDVRPGGRSFMIMRGPEGQEFPSHGIYLDVVKNRRIVFTDAYTEAWLPSARPFMTGIVTFDGEDGRTRYAARVLHWNEADRKEHEAMGFHDGWGKAADQLQELVGRI